jgi:E3 ubiquitin-protein ligase RNF38/44
MFMYSAVVSFMHVFKPYLEERARLMTQATNIRNIIDALGLIWFVVGNMWLFGDDDNSCRHPEKSPIYGLCISMLIINYIQICLPCIIAVILIPVFCFCMPCLIRVLARLQNNRGVSQGATEQAISQLPVTIVAEEHVNNLGEENTCPICLNEMVVGDEARLLRCKHIFHKNCVDEWLRVNASCPTCRKSIFEESDAGSSSGGPSSGAQGSSSGSGSGSGGGGGGGGGANSRNASVSNSGALEGDVELSNPLQSVNASTHSESGLLGTSLPQADSSISLSVTQSALHDR